MVIRDSKRQHAFLACHEGFLGLYPQKAALPCGSGGRALAGARMHDEAT